MQFDPKLLSLAKNDGITGALIVKTEGNQVAAILNVEKDVGKIIANANIPK
ncbi:hypothetical protein [Orientia tsutsugamushi]|uniref:hypothetical protein n=1 Tax=Orientia tsutsugamushi TaxID=784 RepID=UPI004046B6E3